MALKLSQKKQDKQTALKTTASQKFYSSEYYEESEDGSTKVKQILKTIIYTIGIFFLFYCTGHYVPAFTDIPKAFHLTNVDKNERYLAGENVGNLTPLIEQLSLKRGYVYQGKTVIAQYDIPEGAVLSLKIQPCRTFLIMEIFICNPQETRSAEISNAKFGQRKFTFKESGFFQFRYSLDAPEGSLDDRDRTHVLWSREYPK